VKGVGTAGGSYDDCAANVEQSAKVQKAQERVQKIEATRCTVTPPFAYSSAATVIAAAAGQELSFVKRVFGADVAAAIQPSTATCQAGVLAALQKCRDTTLGGFNECKQQEIQLIEPSSTTPQRDLASACIRQGIFTERRLTGEPRLFWQNCRYGVGKAIVDGCDAPTPAEYAALLPGQCAGSTDNLFCFKGLVACNTCRGLDVADALGIDGMDYDASDQVDNEQLDGSCS
jgi:hypothetical protein